MVTHLHGFAAEVMGVSERTLARRLSACGLTYKALIDEVRFTEAKKLLLEPRVRIEDVALSVGFDEQGNFTRMFRRVSGLNPTEFRNMQFGQQRNPGSEPARTSR